MKRPIEPKKPIQPEQPKEFYDKRIDIEDIKYGCTLKEIIEKLPSDISFENVHISYTDNEYEDEYSTLEIYYLVKTKAPNYKSAMIKWRKDMEKFLKEIESYKEKYNSFQDQKTEYDLWNNEQKIKKLEKQLAKLKK